MVQNEEKDELGEDLYKKISETHPDEAAKLTGMMLDSLEVADIHRALEEDAFLQESIEQAMKCLGVDWEAKAMEMQEELKEAEVWAAEVQQQLDDWGEKEQAWKKEKEELQSRLSRLEAEETKKSSNKIGDLTKKAEDDAKRLRDLEKQNEELLKSKAAAEDTDKQMRDVEKQNVKLQEELRKIKEREKELEDSLAKAKAATASKSDTAKEEEKKPNEEVSMADKLKGDMVAKYKADLAAKEEELARVKAELKAASAVNGNGKHKNGFDSTSLEQKLHEAEALAKTSTQRAAEAERRSKQAEEELEVARKDIERTQSKSDKSRELQQDLEQAHREIKSYKTQNSKAQQEITELKKKMKGAGLVAESPKKEAPKQKDPPVAPPEKTKADASAKIEEEKEHPEDIEVEEEEQEQDVEEEEVAPEPVRSQSDDRSRKPVTPSTARSQAAPLPSKVQATAAAKANGKKKGGVAPPPPAAKAKRKSSFQCSGTHVVAGCLALVVMIQAGLFVYESLYGETLR